VLSAIFLFCVMYLQHIDLQSSLSRSCATHLSLHLQAHESVKRFIGGLKAWLALHKELPYTYTRPGETPDVGEWAESMIYLRRILCTR
jgi:hypothetical protein